ncbi:Holliday junction branch migration protein RuvA [bacterium]|nr:Holliday junction branch migration protein RuvA [bacterium]
MTYKTINEVHLEAGGVGYSLAIPRSTFDVLPGEGQELMLLTHFVVKEDRHELYGFATECERSLFRKLLTVNRVGGSIALAILSSFRVGEFVTIVNTDNVRLLTNVSGLGKKGAERVILELKNKLDDVSLVETGVSEEKLGLTGEAIEALCALGYNRSQASGIVGMVMKQEGIKDLQALLREAFKLLRNE